MENKTNPAHCKTNPVHYVAYTSCFWIISILSMLVVLTFNGYAVTPPAKQIERTLTQKQLLDIYDNKGAK